MIVGRGALTWSATADFDCNSDVVSWHVMVSAYLQAGRPSEQFQAFTGLHTP